MAIRLPILPAARIFYTPVTVYITQNGRYEDGDWVSGETTQMVISGSFQPPSPLKLDIGMAGDVGLGERSLWTTADLPFYDIYSTSQAWVWRESRWWRLTERHAWDSHVSHNLFVYGLERYHKTENGPQPPPGP